MSFKPRYTQRPYIQSSRHRLLWVCVEFFIKYCGFVLNFSSRAAELELLIRSGFWTVPVMSSLQ